MAKLLDTANLNDDARDYKILVNTLTDQIKSIKTMISKMDALREKYAENPAIFAETNGTMQQCKQALLATANDITVL